MCLGPGTLLGYLGVNPNCRSINKTRPQLFPNYCQEQELPQTPLKFPINKNCAVAGETDRSPGTGQGTRGGGAPQLSPGGVSAPTRTFGAPSQTPFHQAPKIRSRKHPDRAAASPQTEQVWPGSWCRMNIHLHVRFASCLCPYTPACKRSRGQP